MLIVKYAGSDHLANGKLPSGAFFSATVVLAGKTPRAKDTLNKGPV
jgi:hypothetical protein